ncbi:SusC/RagA family TonB-linked outer membrane protein [Geofilum sp. OHC36d9]|uniref:SusC/RagA family TonB-linked outer membrane protein n=1 Tax=Geofilum sp. OHC36d9 TaxID=3458413 RepID=UPI0040339E5F
MFKILKSALLIFVLFVTSVATAQQRAIIRGKVTSELEPQGVIGVTVAELDKNNRLINGTVTNLDGDYLMEISSTDNKLQFSSIGYIDLVVDIAGKSVINAKLSESVVQLAGAEIVGQRRTNTGVMTVPDRDLAIPISKISADNFEDLQASSIDDALQGRLAGVDIASNSGDPGAGMSIRIRGVSTLTANSTPLIVVDNIPYEVNVSSDFNFGTANEEGYSQMLNIPVDDIKEITVLKDAAATAMWGTKAANGVLLITTKRGTSSRKPVVSYTYRGTYTFDPGHVPLLSGAQYSNMIQEAYYNSFGVPINTANFKEFSNSSDEPYYFYNYGANTDWMSAVSRNGYVNNHDFSITGGGQKAFYRFSANYQDQQGTTLGTDMNRLSARLNLDYIISDKLKMRADFSVAHGVTNGTFTDDNVIRSNKGTDVRSIAYKKMPNMSIYEYDAYGNKTDNFFSPLSNSQGTFPTTYNPVAMATDGVNKTTNDRITTKYSLYYDIIPGLRYTLDLSFDVVTNKINRFLPQTASGKEWTNQWVNKAYDKDDDSYYIYTNNMLNYNKTFNNIHQIYAALNFTTNENIGDYYKIWTSNSVSSVQQDPSNDSKVNESGVGPESGPWHGRSLGSTAMINYILRDKYIMAFSARYEGNSKFDDNNRFGLFPGMSLAWRLSKENFLLSATKLNDLRLRFSYGQNGNSPKYEGLFFSNIGSFDWNYLGNSAIYTTDLQLKNLKWETLIETNYGITTEMFDGRLSFDFDYYQKRTKDMFAEKTVVNSTTGFSQLRYTNLGTMDNLGWDFSIRTIPIKKKDWMMTFDFNIARNYNVLRSVSDNFALERNETIGNGEYKNIVQIDNPVGSFYGYRYKGVYTDESQLIARDVDGNQIADPNGNAVPMVYDYDNARYYFELGDARYEDINHDGNINASDIVYLGNANPDFFGGFGSLIKYKNWSFNYFFHFRVGNDVINMTKMKGEAMFNFDNQLASVERRWRRPGDQTDIPRALMGKGYNYLGSDRFVEDGSFMRLKYITLTYRFPRTFVNNLGLQTMRMSATVNNLFTLTNYSGQDPDISINSKDGTIYTVGYDYSNTPRSREFTFNLAVTF